MTETITLTVNNFKRYDTKTTFTLPKTGLVLLQGASGIGKTSILDAIYFLLYGIGSKIVNFSATNCSVSMSDGTTIITRTKKPNRLTLQEKASGVVYEDLVAQEIINNRYGTNFEITSYIKYKASTSFFSLGPSARMEFLQKIAIKGTDVQMLKNRTKASIKTRKERLLQISGEIAVVETEFNQLEEPEPVKFPFGKFHETKIKNHKIRSKNNKIKLSNSEKVLHQTMRLQKEFLLQKQSNSFIKDKIDRDTIELDKYSQELTNLEDIVKSSGDVNITFLRKQLTILESNKIHDELKAKLSQSERELQVCKQLEDAERNKELQRLQKIPSIENKTGYYLQMIQTKRNIEEANKRIATNEKAIQNIEDVDYDMLDKLNIQLENTKCKKFTCPGCLCDLVLKDERLQVYSNSLDMKSDTTTIKNKIDRLRENLKRRDALLGSIQSDKKFLETNKAFDMNIDYDKLYKENVEQVEVQTATQVEIRKLQANLYSPAFHKMENDVKQLSASLKKCKYTEITSTYRDIENLRQLIFKTEQDIQHRERIQTKIDELNRSINNDKLRLKDIQDEDFDYKIGTLESEINDLKKAIKQDEENEILLNTYFSYTEKQENYDKWKSRLENLKFTEKNAIKSLEVAETFLSILNETESKAVANIINLLNINLKYYSEQFFTEPIGIQIQPFRESQNGNIKPSVHIKVSYKGMDYDTDCLSGGETSRVELAICLAINSVINGKILLLDEVLGTLNSGYIDTITSVLREEALKENKLILTVLHGASEGNFDNVITVE